MLQQLELGSQNLSCVTNGWEGNDVAILEHLRDTGGGHAVALDAKVGLALEAVGIDARKVLGPLPEGVEDARTGRKGNNGTTGPSAVVGILLGRGQKDKDVVASQIGLSSRERFDVRGDPLGTGADALGAVFVVVGAVASSNLGIELTLNLLEATLLVRWRRRVCSAIDLVPMPLLDGLEVGLVVEAGRLRSRSRVVTTVEAGTGPATGVGTVDRRVALAGISTALGILLVIEVGGQPVLGNLVHLAGPDLNLEGPVDTAPPRRGGVVQALISVGLGTVDVVLEAPPLLVQVGLPVLGTQTLDVVAQGPLPCGGNVVGFVGRLLLGVEDHPERQGVGHVEQPRGPGLEDLAPQAVGFLDTGADDDVVGGLGEGGVGVQHSLDVLGDPAEDPGHALADGQGVGVVGVAVGVVVVDDAGFPPEVHDAVVLAAVLEAEGGALQLVLEAVHPQPAGEGGVDVQRGAGLADLLGSEGGGGRRAVVAGGLQPPQTVQAGGGADGQGAPVARLGEEEVLHVGVGILAVDVGAAGVGGKAMVAAGLGAEGGVRHGLGPLEARRIGGNPIGLVVVGRAGPPRGSCSAMVGRVHVGVGARAAAAGTADSTSAVQLGLGGGKGLGGHFEHFDRLTTGRQQGRAAAEAVGRLPLSDVVALAVVPHGRYQAGNAHLHGVHQNVTEFRGTAHLGLVAMGGRSDGGKDRVRLRGGEVGGNHGIAQGLHGGVDLRRGLRGGLQPSGHARTNFRVGKFPRRVVGGSGSSRRRLAIPTGHRHAGHVVRRLGGGGSSVVLPKVQTAAAAAARACAAASALAGDAANGPDGRYRGSPALHECLDRVAAGRGTALQEGQEGHGGACSGCSATGGVFAIGSS